MMWRFLFVAMLVVISLSCALPGVSKAGGPWKAQVVDAEIGKPLEGVVVLAVWYRHMRGLGVHGTLGYGDSEEVVTDNDGGFTISARSSFTLNPFVYLEDPKFYIFKPGYGRWRFRNADLWVKLNLPERYEGLRKVWGSRGEKDLMLRFQGEMLKMFNEAPEKMSDVTIELPPLKTRKERLDSLPYVPGDVPWEKTQRMREARDSERRYLGLD